MYFANIFHMFAKSTYIYIYIYANCLCRTQESSLQKFHIVIYHHIWSWVSQIRNLSLWCYWSLTHWGRHKMAAVFQTLFSGACSWMKMFQFRLKFHWTLFVRVGPMNNIPALVQIMAWRRPGDKPLSDPTMAILQTHIRVTRPKWVKRKACAAIKQDFYPIFFISKYIYTGWTIQSDCSSMVPSYRIKYT